MTSRRPFDRTFIALVVLMAIASIAIRFAANSMCKVRCGPGYMVTGAHMTCWCLDGEGNIMPPPPRL